MTRRATYSFVASMVLLVALPVMLTALGHFHISFDLTDVLLYMVYFRLPRLLFGRAHFYSDIATSPAGMSGWMLTILFYTVMSLAIALIVGALQERTKKSSEPGH